jgi:hypothetical protein
MTFFVDIVYFTLNILGQECAREVQHSSCKNIWNKICRKTTTITHLNLITVVAEHDSIRIFKEQWT